MMEEHEGNGEENHEEEIEDQRVCTVSYMKILFFNKK